VSLVAERVPPSVNNMDVLNEYFLQFGPVTAMQINHNRHEAIVTFARVENAEEAMRWPVLNDPSIGLRPWRSKAGQRGPHEVPTLESPDGAPQSGEAGTPATERAPDAASASNLPGSAEVPGASNENVSAHASLDLKGNRHLETGKLLENKRKHGELEDRRKHLLQGLTDQLKKVMAKISNPETTEKNRDQLQVILATIKDKITILTPKHEQAKPRLRVAPPLEWHAEEEAGQTAPSATAPQRSQATRWSSWRPRAPAWAQPWQNDWTVPSHPTAQADEPAISAETPAEATEAPNANNAVEQEQDDGEASGGETEAMESDIEDLELLAAMAAAAAAAAAETPAVSPAAATPAATPAAALPVLASAGGSTDAAADGGSGADVFAQSAAESRGATAEGRPSENQEPSGSPTSLAEPGSLPSTSVAEPSAEQPPANAGANQDAAAHGPPTHEPVGAA